MGLNNKKRIANPDGLTIRLYCEVFYERFVYSIYVVEFSDYLLFNFCTSMSTVSCNFLF